ncbi:MAG: polysaccharide biosynthesis/export family protein [Desulfatibacillaceae bacterium]
MHTHTHLKPGAGAVRIAWVLAVLLACMAATVSAATAGEPGGVRYTIMPGDRLDISVWREPELSREILVPPDGVVSFPLIGDVHAAGKSVTELRADIYKRISEFIPDVSVSVILLQPSVRSAYVIGKVAHPGQFPIKARTTVVQVLSMAGGLDRFASPGDILVLRAVDGKTETYAFDYGEMEKGRNLEQNIKVEDGDVILVP